MKKSLFISAMAILLISIFSSCKKENNEVSATTTITITNSGNNTYNGISHQFTSLELTPTDGSSTTKTYSFVSTRGATISVGVNLPKSGSYKIKVFANNSAGYIQWNSIAMEIGSTTAMNLYCPGNMSYKDGSTAAGIAPDLTSGL
jgi:hypothetical protein